MGRDINNMAISALKSILLGLNTRIIRSYVLNSYMNINVYLFFILYIILYIILFLKAQSHLSQSFSPRFLLHFPGLFVELKSHMK